MTLYLKLSININAAKAFVIYGLQSTRHGQRLLSNSSWTGVPIVTVSQTSDSPSDYQSLLQRNAVPPWEPARGGLRVCSLPKAADAAGTPFGKSFQNIAALDVNLKGKPTQMREKNQEPRENYI